MGQLRPLCGRRDSQAAPRRHVSNDDANRNLNRVQVVPITSSVQKLYPGEAYVSLDGEARKAMADQLTTASKQRFGDRIGMLSAADMKKIDQAIRVQLDLNG